MISPLFARCAKARESLVNQPIGHSWIICQSSRQPGIARANAPVVLAHQNARGNPGLNPTWISMHDDEVSSTGQI
jgi:hypothetical protein